MAGPNGEVCSTCYYLTEGRCRVIAPQLSRVNSPASSAGYLQGYPGWPRVQDNDWCGQWVDAESPVSNTLAIGSYLTPDGTSFSITDDTVYTRFNPAGLVTGALMYNVTLVDGQLQVDIPGAYDLGTSWVASVSFYGSVNFPNANTFVQFAPTVDDAVFNANVTQKLSVNPQTDDLDLAFSMSGVGVGAQTINTEIGVRGDIGLATFTSLVYQVRISLL